MAIIGKIMEVEGKRHIDRHKIFEYEFHLGLPVYYLREAFNTHSAEAFNTHSVEAFNTHSGEAFNTL